MPFDFQGIAAVSGQRPVDGQDTAAAQINVPLADIQAMLSQLLLKSGVAPMLGNLNMNNFKIVGLGEGSNDGDVATVAQVNAVASATPTGIVAMFRRKTAPSGWVVEKGTIGNSSSNATNRANSDTLSLFTLMWTEFTNTELPIQDSAGAASTRGASAAADFAANKRMPLFDSRSRFSRAADDGLAYDVGLTVGAQQADIFKSHTHVATIGPAGAHTHDLPAGNGSTGAGSVVYGSSSSPLGLASPGMTAAPNHTHTATIDATGDALETRPRSSVYLFCIKL
jgi:hypothetical protein